MRSEFMGKLFNRVYFFSFNGLLEVGYYTPIPHHTTIMLFCCAVQEEEYTNILVTSNNKEYRMRLFRKNKQTSFCTELTNDGNWLGKQIESLSNELHHHHHYCLTRTTQVVGSSCECRCWFSQHGREKHISILPPIHHSQYLKTVIII